jgi:hypothetical protein
MKTTNEQLIAQGSEFRLIKVVYQFRHSKMGFENQITIEARTPDEAIEGAKLEIVKTYGKSMSPRFTYKTLPI